MQVYVVAKSKEGKVVYKGWSFTMRTEEGLEVRGWFPKEYTRGNTKWYSLTNSQKKEIEEYTR